MDIARSLVAKHSSEHVLHHLLHHGRHRWGNWSGKNHWRICRLAACYNSVARIGNVLLRLSISEWSTGHGTGGSESRNGFSISAKHATTSAGYASRDFTIVEFCFALNLLSCDLNSSSVWCDVVAFCACDVAASIATTATVVRSHGFRKPIRKQALTIVLIRVDSCDVVLRIVFQSLRVK